MIICLCENINEKKITQLVSEGCQSVSDIRKNCQASGDCGSCIFKIHKIIREVSSQLDEDCEQDIIL